jgi:hypothetical protein
MKKPTGIEVVRRASPLGETGKPEGRDQEFCHQAERELEAQSEDPEIPNDILVINGNTTVSIALTASRFSSNNVPQGGTICAVATAIRTS